MAGGTARGPAPNTIKPVLHYIDGEFRDALDGRTTEVVDPGTNPAAQTYRKAIFEQGIPATMFGVADVRAEYERLRGLGVEFRTPPATDGANRSVQSAHGPLAGRPWLRRHRRSQENDLLSFTRRAGRRRRLPACRSLGRTAPLPAARGRSGR